MMRERPLLLLLDEPTAAHDARAEHDLFERYAGSADGAAATVGGITLLVSHRLARGREADLILVDDGNTIAVRNPPAAHGNSPASTRALRIAGPRLPLTRPTAWQSRAPSPGFSPAESPVLDLFTNGLSTSEVSGLPLPALAGAVPLLVEYIRHCFIGAWTPHWSRGVVGLLLMAASVPACFTFAGRVESPAAEEGVPVITFVVAGAA